MVERGSKQRSALAHGDSGRGELALPFPWLARTLGRLGGPSAIYHRFGVEGLERVPAGGCLLVANHSSGAVVESLLLVRAWYQHFPRRPLRLLGHRLFWRLPEPVPRLMREIGAVPASGRVARRALEAGEAVLVFPGGEREVSRPFSQRHRITLGRRSGFAALARAAGVPVVPVVIEGSHACYFVLPGGEHWPDWLPLERWFGAKALPMTAGGVAFALALGAAALAPPLLWPLPALALAQAVTPLPARIRIRVLEPMDIAALERPAAQVRAVMQAAMDELRAS